MRKCRELGNGAMRYFQCIIQFNMRTSKCRVKIRNSQPEKSQIQSLKGIRKYRVSSQAEFYLKALIIAKTIQDHFADIGGE